MFLLTLELLVRQGFTCPHPSELHFQKVIGYYPFSATIRWEEYRTSPLECLKLCRTDDNCLGYIYHVSEHKCSQISRPSEKLPGNRDSEEDSRKKLVPDPSVIFFEKACLSCK